MGRKRPENLTLFDLVMADAKVQFPGGFWIKGDTIQFDIDIGKGRLGIASYEATYQGFVWAISSLAKMMAEAGATKKVIDIYPPL